MPLFCGKSVIPCCARRRFWLRRTSAALRFQDRCLKPLGHLSLPQAREGGLVARVWRYAKYSRSNFVGNTVIPCCARRRFWLRRTFAALRFQDRCLTPLGHLSLPQARERGGLWRASGDMPSSLAVILLEIQLFRAAHGGGFGCAEPSLRSVRLPLRQVPLLQFVGSLRSLDRIIRCIIIESKKPHHHEPEEGSRSPSPKC